MNNHVSKTAACVRGKAFQGGVLSKTAACVREKGVFRSVLSKTGGCVRAKARFRAIRLDLRGPQREGGFVDSDVSAGQTVVLGTAGETVALAVPVARGKLRQNPDTSPAFGLFPREIGVCPDTSPRFGYPPETPSFTPTQRSTPRRKRLRAQTKNSPPGCFLNGFPPSRFKFTWGFTRCYVLEKSQMAGVLGFEPR